MNFAELIGVEILRAGTWNGIKFTNEDLAEIAENASVLGYTPPVKVGHTDDPGGRAYGWVHNVRVTGEKLLADIRDMPDAIAALVKEKAYNALSPEVFFNLKRDGRVFRRALKAVAILGAEIPAIDGLRPLSEALLTEAEYESISNIDDLGRGSDDMEIDELKKAHQKADADIAALKARIAESDAAIAKMAEENAKLTNVVDGHTASSAELKAMLDKQRAVNVAMKLTQKVSAVKIPAYRSYFSTLYGHAMAGEHVVKFSEKDASLESVLDEMVSKMNEAQSWMFKEVSQSGGNGSADYSTYAEAGAEVAKRAAKLTSEKGLSYSQAVRQVLDEDPALKSTYSEV